MVWWAANAMIALAIPNKAPWSFPCLVTTTTHLARLSTCEVETARHSRRELTERLRTVLQEASMVCDCTLHTQMQFDFNLGMHYGKLNHLVLLPRLSWSSTSSLPLQVMKNHWGWHAKAKQAIVWWDNTHSKRPMTNVKHETFDSRGTMQQSWTDLWMLACQAEHQEMLTQHTVEGQWWHVVTENSVPDWALAPLLSLKRKSTELRWANFHFKTSSHVFGIYRLLSPTQGCSIRPSASWHTLWGMKSLMSTSAVSKGQNSFLRMLKSSCWYR